MRGGERGAVQGWVVRASHSHPLSILIHFGGGGDVLEVTVLPELHNYCEDEKDQYHESGVTEVSAASHGPPFTGSDRMQVLGCSAQTGQRAAYGVMLSLQWLYWEWNGTRPRARVR
jgi:hypothetical protein